jgi:hypothetical protein
MFTALAACLTDPVVASASMKARWRSGVQPSWRAHLRGDGGEIRQLGDLAGLAGGSVLHDHAA